VICEIGREDNETGAHFVVLLPAQTSEERKRGEMAAPQQVFSGG
jgi:hypothetical protein